MKGRRQFFKIILGFFTTLITLKFYKIANAMNKLPYHHLSDGNFRNLPGSPKRQKYLTLTDLDGETETDNITNIIEPFAG